MLEKIKSRKFGLAAGGNTGIFATCLALGANPLGVAIVCGVVICVYIISETVLDCRKMQYEEDKK